MSENPIRENAEAASKAQEAVQRIFGNAEREREAINQLIQLRTFALQQAHDIVRAFTEGENVLPSPEDVVDRAERYMQFLTGPGKGSGA